MIANLAANILVLIHFGFILFVVLGGLLVLKWRKIAYLHIPCVLWGSLIEVGGWLCPLTPLELHLRQLAGEAGYTGGFIDHYVMPLVYPPGLTRGMQIWIGAIIIVVNLCVYARVAAKRSKRKKDHPPT